MPFKKRCKPVTCASGLTLSVQASVTHYCEPRNDAGPYTKVEIGFPSKKVEALMPYIDGDRFGPTENVYGYVPVQVVLDVIEANGGQVDGELPPIAKEPSCLTQLN